MSGLELSANYFYSMIDGWCKPTTPPHDVAGELEDYIQAKANECLANGEVNVFGDVISVVDAYREFEGEQISSLLKMRNADTYKEGLAELDQMLFEKLCWLIELAHGSQEVLAD